MIHAPRQASSIRDPPPAAPAAPLAPTPERLGGLSPHPGVSKGVHRSVIITIVCCHAAAAPDIFKSQGDSEISGENILDTRVDLHVFIWLISLSQSCSVSDSPWF